MRKNRVFDPATKFFVIIIGLTFIVLTLKELNHIFIPFVIAYFIYFTFSPANNYLKKYKVPEALITLLNIITLVLISWGISVFLIDSFSNFSNLLPEYSKRLNDTVRSAAISLNIKDPYFRNFNIEKVIQKIDYRILAGSIFNSTFSFLGSVLFVILFYIFIVSGHGTMVNAIKKRYVFNHVQPDLIKMKRVLSSEKDINNIKENENLLHQKEEMLMGTFKAITEQIQRYIILKIGINLLAGVLSFILFSILGIDFPIIWAVFVFIFNFIPSIGSAIALVLPTLMALLQFSSASYVLLTAGLIAALQTVIFNVIEPALIGKRLNLNPLLILISVLIWGYIWGIVGMLLAVPLTAIIKIIIANSESSNMIFINDLMSKE